MERIRVAVAALQLCVAIAATLVALGVLPSTTETNAALLAILSALSGAYRMGSPRHSTSNGSADL